MKGLPPALTRHIRFYIALVCGVAAWAACRLFEAGAAPLAGGDVFYLVFLAFCIPLIRQKSADLKKRAKSQDEGIAVVVFITLATMTFFTVAVFTALNGKHAAEILPLALAGLGRAAGLVRAAYGDGLPLCRHPLFRRSRMRGRRKGLAVPRQRRRSLRVGLSLLFLCRGA